MPLPSAASCEDDADGDGTVDCVDECASNPDKLTPGRCGCETSDADTDGDGEPDCEDACNGVDDASYVADATCGVGYCRATNTPSSCASGVETACVPGSPLGADDVTCDGVDDNCSGAADENYATSPTSCGMGACASSGELVCSGGAVVDTCTPGTALTSIDDATWPGNGVDDDCDGAIDEDSPNPCDRTPRLFEAGAYANLTVPLGCGHVTVQLWGGGGGSGGNTSVGTTGDPGRGGSGGYAESTLAISGVLDLVVGSGGEGCGDGGANPNATYSGGNGGPGSQGGEPGADGNVAGGGAGGAASGAGEGGDGHFGGGGGGGGVLAPWPPYPGTGGGGGAASVFSVGGTRVVTAGGGGGGGGANGSSVASTGGDGGEGCAGAGGTGSAAGGGGGGICEGGVTQQGADGVPHPNATLPNGRAQGAGSDCQAGGAGFAIVTFSP